MAVVYTSRVIIERFGGGVRLTKIPVDTPVRFGMHDDVAEHYGLEAGAFERGVRETKAATSPAIWQHAAGRDRVPTR